MRVRVLLFAGLRETVGRKELVLEPDPGCSVAEVLDLAERQEPALRGMRERVIVALNQERQPLTARVHDGDEVALLPPVSGGAEAVRVQADPLSMDALLAEVTAPECGGIVTFTGVVRNHSRGEAILRLEYEAYQPMAERELRRITRTVRERWPEVRLALAHRLGRLEIGEAAVMIAASAPHRDVAFEACRFAIDTLKQTAPIWKKEFAESGARWIEENP
ncbi:MAG: molybdenum cofactor biosynthesis protein MoaE [Myxococcota bacterium]